MTSGGLETSKRNLGANLGCEVCPGSSGPLKHGGRELRKELGRWAGPEEVGGRLFPSLREGAAPQWVF